MSVMEFTGAKQVDPTVETLAGDMKPREIVEVLRRLRFLNKYDTVRIDRDARDFIVRRLTER